MLFTFGLSNLKPGAFEGLDIIDDAMIQICERSRVDVDFEAVHVRTLYRHRHPPPFSNDIE